MLASKSPIFGVHAKTLSQRFQIFTLWKAFSKSILFKDRKRRLRVDGRLKRTKRSQMDGYAGWGPELLVYYYLGYLCTQGNPKWRSSSRRMILEITGKYLYLRIIS